MGRGISGIIFTIPILVYEPHPDPRPHPHRGIILHPHPRPQWRSGIPMGIRRFSALLN